MAEKTETSVNASLNDFIDGKAEASAPTSENKPVEQQVQATAPDTSENEPELIDPSKITLGRANDGDGLRNQLDEDDWEEVQFGDKKIKVSKKVYTIKAISKQDELAIKKISTGDFIDSRDGKSRWVQTRLEITYTEGDYKTSLPNLKWFEDKFKANHYAPSFKKIKTEKEFQNTFTSQVSKLYFKFCQQFQKSPGDFGQEEFFEGLVGKKVQLTEHSEEFDGKTYFRLDIFKFV